MKIQQKVKHIHLLLVRSEVAVRVRRLHAHGWINRRRRRRSIRCAGRARIVLAPAPAQADARIADRIALHLVDGHLGRVSLDELHESAAFSGRDLDVGDFSKALEERPEFIFRDVARQASDEDGGVVGVRELVHWLWSTVIAHGRSTHRVHPHGTADPAATTTTSLLHASTHTSWSAATALVLRSCRRYTHGSVATVHALHIRQ